jgi:hypothetical protein
MSKRHLFYIALLQCKMREYYKAIAMANVMEWVDKAYAKICEMQCMPKPLNLHAVQDAVWEGEE